MRSHLDDDGARNFVVPGLAIFVPNHPEVTEVEDLPRDDVPEQLAAERPPKPGGKTIGDPDHLDSNNFPAPGLAGFPFSPNVDEDHAQDTNDDQSNSTCN